MTLDEINAAQLLGNLTRNQAHAARSLLDECPWCGQNPCPEREMHDRLDAMSEVTWWRASKGVKA